ncbi:MAG: SIMPL domain-containing protein [Holosporales bacterium]|nr:SIMPL domain-containing protein [Holosporales bacterium]
MGKYVIYLLGIAAFLFIGYKAVEVVDKSKFYISTNGLSDKIVKADYAKWSISIVDETNSLKDTQEKRKSDKKIVVDFLKKCGFKESEISEGGVRIEDQLRWSSEGEKNSKKKYSITDYFFVQTPNVDLVEKSATKISQLMDQNIRIENNRVKYLYKDFEKLRIEMIEEAAKDSRNRADHIAKTSKRKIIGMRNFSTGRFSILAEDTSAESDRGWESESSIIKRVRVIVSASYDIE